MRRKIFSFVALLSLVLCVATVLLGMRSFHRPGWREFHWGGREWRFAIANGRVGFDNEPQRKSLCSTCGYKRQSYPQIAQIFTDWKARTRRCVQTERARQIGNVMLGKTWENVHDERLHRGENAC